jgi:hypothetical protein
MAREIAYRLNSAPQGRNDGSAQIDHDVAGLYRDSTGVAWSDAPVIPGYHQTFLLDAADVEVVMDMPDSTGPQRQAKNLAYKVLMEQKFADTANPNRAPSQTDWTEAGMIDYMDDYDEWEAAVTLANNAAALEAGRVDTYLTVTLGESYPVEFQL